MPTTPGVRGTLTRSAVAAIPPISTTAVNTAKTLRLISVSAKMPSTVPGIAPITAGMRMLRSICRHSIVDRHTTSSRCAIRSGAGMKFGLSAIKSGSAIRFIPKPTAPWTVAPSMTAPLASRST